MNYGPDDFVIVEVSLRELEVVSPVPWIVLRSVGALFSVHLNLWVELMVRTWRCSVRCRPRVCWAAGASIPDCPVIAGSAFMMLTGGIDDDEGKKQLAWRRPVDGPCSCGRSARQRGSAGAVPGDDATAACSRWSCTATWAKPRREAHKRNQRPPLRGCADATGIVKRCKATQSFGMQPSAHTVSNWATSPKDPFSIDRRKFDNRQRFPAASLGA